MEEDGIGAEGEPEIAQLSGAVGQVFGGGRRVRHVCNHGFERGPSGVREGVSAVSAVFAEGRPGNGHEAVKLFCGQCVLVNSERYLD